MAADIVDIMEIPFEGTSLQYAPKQEVDNMEDVFQFQGSQQDLLVILADEFIAQAADGDAQVEGDEFDPDLFQDLAAHNLRTYDPQPGRSLAQRVAVVYALGEALGVPPKMVAAAIGKGLEVNGADLVIMRAMLHDLAAGSDKELPAKATDWRRVNEGGFKLWLEHIKLQLELQEGAMKKQPKFDGLLQVTVKGVRDVPITSPGFFGMCCGGQNPPLYVEAFTVMDYPQETVSHRLHRELAPVDAHLGGGGGAAMFNVTMEPFTLDNPNGAVRLNVRERSQYGKQLDYVETKLDFDEIAKNKSDHPVGKYSVALYEWENKVQQPVMLNLYVPKSKRADAPKDELPSRARYDAIYAKQQGVLELGVTYYAEYRGKDPDTIGQTYAGDYVMKNKAGDDRDAKFAKWQQIHEKRQQVRVQKGQSTGMDGQAATERAKDAYKLMGSTNKLYEIIHDTKVSSDHPQLLAYVSAHHVFGRLWDRWGGQPITNKTPATETLLEARGGPALEMPSGEAALKIRDAQLDAAYQEKAPEGFFDDVETFCDYLFDDLSQRAHLYAQNFAYIDTSYSQSDPRPLLPSPEARRLATRYSRGQFLRGPTQRLVVLRLMLEQQGERYDLLYLETLRRLFLPVQLALPLGLLMETEVYVRNYLSGLLLRRTAALLGNVYQLRDGPGPQPVASPQLLPQGAGLGAVLNAGLQLTAMAVQFSEDVAGIEALVRRPLHASMTARVKDLLLLVGGQPNADATLVGGDDGDVHNPVVQLAALRDVARVCIVDTLADVELLNLNPQAANLATYLLAQRYTQLKAGMESMFRIHPVMPFNQVFRDAEEAVLKLHNTLIEAKLPPHEGSPGAKYSSNDITDEFPELLDFDSHVTNTYAQWLHTAASQIRSNVDNTLKYDMDPMDGKGWEPIGSTPAGSFSISFKEFSQMLEDATGRITSTSLTSSPTRRTVLAPRLTTLLTLAFERYVSSVHAACVRCLADYRSQVVPAWAYESRDEDLGRLLSNFRKTTLSSTGGRDDLKSVDTSTLIPQAAIVMINNIRKAEELFDDMASDIAKRLGFEPDVLSQTGQQPSNEALDDDVEDDAIYDLKLERGNATSQTSEPALARLLEGKLLIHRTHAHLSSLTARIIGAKVKAAVYKMLAELAEASKQKQAAETTASRGLFSSLSRQPSSQAQASFADYKRMAHEDPEKRKKRNMATWRAKARVIGHFGMLESLKKAQLGNIELNILDINHVLGVVNVIDNEFGNMVGTLNEALQPGLFQHVWKAIMAGFDAIVLNTDEDPTPATSDEVKGLQELWFVLLTVFHADGSGLPKETLEVLSRRTRDLITYAQLPTDALRAELEAINARNRTTTGFHRQPSTQSSGQVRAVDMLQIICQRKDAGAEKLLAVYLEPNDKNTLQVYLGFPENTHLLYQVQCHLAPNGGDGMLYLTKTSVAFLPKAFLPNKGRKLRLKDLQQLSRNRLKLRLGSLTNMEALFYRRSLGVQFTTVSRERHLFYNFKDDGANALMQEVRLSVMGTSTLLDMRLRGQLETGGEDLPPGLPPGEYRRYPAGWQSRPLFPRELGALLLGRDVLAFAQDDRVRLQIRLSTVVSVAIKTSEESGSFDIVYKEPGDKSQRKATFSDMGDVEMQEVVTEVQYQISQQALAN